MAWTEGARLAQALSNEHYRGRAFGWIFLLLMAAIDLAVALRYRALVPFVVGYHLLQQIGAVPQATR